MDAWRVGTVPRAIVSVWAIVSVSIEEEPITKTKSLPLFLCKHGFATLIASVLSEGKHVHISWSSTRPPEPEQTFRASDCWNRMNIEMRGNAWNVFGSSASHRCGNLTWAHMNVFWTRVRVLMHNPSLLTVKENILLVKDFLYVTRWAPLT